jgi:hypothetical protein
MTMNEIITKINEAGFQVISQTNYQIVIAKDESKSNEANELYKMVCSGKARSWMQYYPRHTVPNYNGYGNKTIVSKKSTGYIINF